jgi:hypothetical protein
MNITMVPSGHIVNVLDSVIPHLHRLAPRTNGRSTVDDILQGILSGANVLWLAFEETEDNHIYGVVITNLMNYPRIRSLNIFYCAGHKLRLWQDMMMDVLKRYAKDNNCTKIELTGRRGWLRALKSWNVTEEYVVCEIELGEQQ